MYTVCFTGHRPNNKNLGGYNWHTYKNVKIMNRLKKEIERIIFFHFEEKIRFICGGALGIDQMAFEIVSELRQKFSNIELEVAIPFKDQPNNWVDKKDKERYLNHLKIANKITYVDEIKEYNSKYPIGTYVAYKMQARNMYMVDCSDLVVAVWDCSKSGGTYNCVSYAIKKEKLILSINPCAI